jgi:integral membrane protein
MSVEAEFQVTPKIKSALRRYRIAAYVVGCGLLALCVAMVFKYGFGAGAGVAIIGPLHGFLYMIYIAMAVDLALKARWSAKGTIGILLAGTIPFVSFVAERAVTRRVRVGRSL